MEPEILRKWKQVKEALKEAGKTDSPFYKRALTVATTGRDPGYFLNFFDSSKS